MSEKMNLSNFFMNDLSEYKNIFNEVKYVNALKNMISQNSKSLILNFSDIILYDKNLANELIENSILLEQLEEVAFKKLRLMNSKYADKIKKIFIRYKNFPYETPIYKIRANHIGKMIMFKGVIIGVSKTRPFILKSCFKCNLCSNLFYVEQEGKYLVEPKICPSCNSKNHIQIFPKESTFIDFKKIKLQELPQCKISRKIDVELMGDVVDKAKLGDKVKVIGSVKLLKRSTGKNIPRTFEIIIQGNNIELIDP